MNDQASLRQLGEVLVDLDEELVAGLTLELLARAVEPVEILTTCEQALASIGEKYEAGEYFISGLIMAGEMMSRITELLTPHLAIPEAALLRGRILIGTIEGDIHDLGKNIAGALLSAHGFQVLDLGVDVSAADFVKAALKFKPEIIGLSALLGSCFPALSQTIARLKEMRGLAKAPAIFISGAQITDEHRKIYGADFQAASAFDTVHLCEKIIRRRLEN
jgi:5-methyltetrahydrofolate--homocysteine methyltransferase